MAEVLSPHMQPSSTITMLHSRPSSSDAFHGSQQYPQPQRMGQAPRSMYNGQNNGFRGTSPPVQAYAFQSTPQLRQETRTVSAPGTSNGLAPSTKSGHAPSASASSTTSSGSSTRPSSGDESSTLPKLPSLINISSQLPDLSLTTFDSPVKASPDRYRRPQQKRVDSNIGQGKSSAPQLAPSLLSNVDQTLEQQPATQMQTSLDDMAVPKSAHSEAAKRYRRRSLNQLDTQTLLSNASLAHRPSSGHGHGAASTPTTIRPVSFHQPNGGEGASIPRNDSSTSVNKVENGRQSPRLHEHRANATTATKVEPKVINVPPRGSSEPHRRLATPSPLSKQASDDDQTPPAASATVKPRTYAAVAQAAANAPSLAAQQLAAVSDKDLNKGMKSRFRRAFSFGGAQELRRAAGENNTAATQQAQQAREQHQQQIDDGMDAEQMEIARRQEAAGIGAGIYSGQGGFSGSTDNLSISSTASSASMMLRKMGRGAKKSARSIKGLFRPKSVIGVPAADGPIAVGPSAPVQPSVAQVSMVTVEAERQNVNVNAHPEERTGGATGYPRLERNSLDAANATALLEARGSADGSDSNSRRSIVGSDRDRAEVLAAVKKGILKRSGTASPSGSPVIRPSDAAVGQVPHILESPASSMPSTPKDGMPARSASIPNISGDYFSRGMTGMTKSMPNTPNGSVRTISFSPRIQFHDAWSSSDYDRRGELATANRLTPMLAQQIKEELNTFKMEMEVHELSKPHTHFF